MTVHSLTRRSNEDGFAWYASTAAERLAETRDGAVLKLHGGGGGSRNGHGSQSEGEEGGEEHCER